MKIRKGREGKAQEESTELGPVAHGCNFRRVGCLNFFPQTEAEKTPCSSFSNLKSISKSTLQNFSLLGFLSFALLSIWIINNLIHQERDSISTSLLCKLLCLFLPSTHHYMLPNPTLSLFSYFPNSSYSFPLILH